MKIHLLPEKGNFYKANLHSHSTISDGKWTVEEMKKNYMAQGYSVIAFTDHQVFVPHNDLTDESFLALNGYEVDIPEDKPWDEYTKTCHFCLIAVDKDRTVQNIYHDSIFIDQNADKVEIAGDRAPIVRRYDPEFISELMEQARADGFFVSYNHPVWSLEDSGDYLNYHGMHALEIINYGGIAAGYDDKAAYIYDIMLRNGKNIYCVGADDNHNVFPIDHPRCDSFGGFTMIKAEKLEYSAVMKAMLDGNMYASEGPLIYELYYDTDDGRIHIKTSEVVKAVMSFGARYSNTKTAAHKGETITEASFSLNRRDDEIVRFIIRDAYGREAFTHAYKVSDIRSALKQHMPELK